MEQRTIKFKAKRLDNGEWVEGDLLHKGNKTYIYKPRINDKGFYTENEQVDPATVCQYTGLKDSEGNEVWEGDILEREIPKGTEGVVIRQATVEFYKGHFTLGYDLTYPLGYTLKGGVFRVIGNIFDRKEGEE